MKCFATVDGNEAAAGVAHRVSEVCAIYPITPSSPMGELADQWSGEGRKNIWGTVPDVIEMQSEGGAAGAAHGALQTGALTTTFTASQGLLLMMPNMFKIAGELTPAVFHVAARSLACQGLSIFGDHSDVMAVRSTGWAMLASASVQEAQDMALVAHAATLRSRVPFIHFFDGFRTSHELQKIELIGDECIRKLMPDELVHEHRRRGLSPEHPVIRGTAQNPDVYFQARETVNPFYRAAPGIVENILRDFEALTGRAYHLFEYCGDAEAERVVVVMGSGFETARDAVRALHAQGERVGVIGVRLYRPFAAEAFMAVLPETAAAVAVLDRTKEPGASGEPLYLDVMAAVHQSETRPGRPPRVVGGRFGLSSKEFTPAMVKAVFDELTANAPRRGFTVGIHDDISGTSLDVDPVFSLERDNVVRAIFYGLGSDGTVGANKNTIKIIGEGTENYAQGYFVYDSKKSGSQTVSHLRFGPEPIHAPYLIETANFIACHQFQFLESIDVLEKAAPGATFLLNAPFEPDAVWDRLPRPMQAALIEKHPRFFVIDAYRVAREAGMGTRINTVMQTCFFAISSIMPAEEAVAHIKHAIEKTYGKKGGDIVRKNFEAVDRTLENLAEVRIPAKATSTQEWKLVVPADAPVFVKNVTAQMMAGKGDRLPVSALPVDGTFPVSTARWEKRNISMFVPAWDPDVCIQCGRCAFVCPHSCIRAKHYPDAAAEAAPASFKSVALRGRGMPGQKYTLQVYVEDCTGCGLCVDVCPAKNKTHAGRKAINMESKAPMLEAERENVRFFETLPFNDRSRVDFSTVRGVQYLEPLFEFSGACSGCGETPYLKVLAQLFGDRLVIANATGCSSIYGGNLPTTPWAQNAEGRGPAWSNSLFEDNAEFGLGFRLSADKHLDIARRLLRSLDGNVEAGLVTEILEEPQKTESQIRAQRERVERLKAQLANDSSAEAQQLLSVMDHFVRRSVWLVGGDGWAYDIGYGGLDHVLASGRNINALVLDTEVYSNTGGQASKATPIAAVAKFASAGNARAKKDLGLMAIAYGNVYVAHVAMGASMKQTLDALREAEAYDGPSLVIAYSHCIAHGINMEHGLRQQKKAVDSGYWPLYRYNPGLAAMGHNPMEIDSKEPTLSLRDYAYNEIRYRMLMAGNPERAEKLMQRAEQDVARKWAFYKFIAGQPFANIGRTDPPGKETANANG